MADLSSNNGEDSPQRAKRSAASGSTSKRKSRQSRNLLTPPGYSSGGELQSQSAFPIPTPDRLGPLTDLLEEDDQTPLESRENSGKNRKPIDWSYLPRPKTPGSTTSSSESYMTEDGGGRGQASPWHNEVAKTRVMAKRYSKVLDETFGTQVEIIEDIEATDKEIPASGGEEAEQVTNENETKKRAVSAKSHIFRKGKIETKLAKMGRHHRTRPWSAHESRLQVEDQWVP